MDIVLVIPPRIKDDYGYTPSGLAAIKGMLNFAGFVSKILDFNVDIDEINDKHTLAELENFFMYYDFYNAHVFAKVEQFINKWATTVLQYDPNWVGISIFSYNSHRATRLLALKIKQLKPNTKIVIGGGGISTDYYFPEMHVKERIIDYYIRGEGELALVELLNGNTTFPGINGIPPQQIDDIEILPYPDYTDYELCTYKNKRGLIAIPITGSRGCVAHCSFCDVAQHMPKYRFRSGKHIADEIKSHSQLYGAKEFRFTDSLINGSMTAFRDMCNELATYRQLLPKDDQFVWDSQYIIRSEKVMPPADYDSMAAAGAKSLLIGVESGSQSVRDHMQKKYTDRDLDYTLEQINRVGIKCRLLMIIGYPTETEEDFQMTLDMFTRFQKYALNGTIEQVNLGLTLNLLPGTPLDSNNEANHIVKLNNHINDWVCLDNPTLTYKERLKRRIYAQKFIKDLGYIIFEEVNYTKQLFSSFTEVKNYDTTAELVIKDFKYSPDTGLLIDNATPITFTPTSIDI